MPHCISLGKYAIDRLIPASAPEHSEFDGTYTYTSDDFKGQDYVWGKDVLEGRFMIPLFDNQPSRAQVGWISWDCQAFPANPNTDDYQKVPVSVQENVIISFGTKNDAPTYDGCGLSVSVGGFYNLNEEYKFGLSDNHGKYLDIIIKKTDGKKREVVVKSVVH